MGKHERSIHDLETPAVLVDVDRLTENIRRYQKMAAEQHVALFPHFKAHKTPHIADIQAKNGAAGFSTATVRETEVLVSKGRKPFTNVVIAYPHVDERSLRRIGVLTAKGEIDLMVQGKQGADVVRAVLPESQWPGIYLAIDTGLHREGMPSQKSSEVIETIRYLCGIFGERFRGILTHAGHAYRAHTLHQVEAIASQERTRMVGLKERCTAAGLPCPEVSIGSTPTFNFFHNDVKHTVTQARPGNYVFMDNTQVSLGVASSSQCALTVLATVLDKKIVTKRTPRGKEVRRGRLITNAGSKVLSSDAKPHGEGGKIHGRVFHDDQARILLEGVRVENLSEEHGWIDIPVDLLDSEIAKIGGQIRILIQHACPVMNLASAGKGYVYVAEGEYVKDRWPVVAGGFRTFRY